MTQILENEIEKQRGKGGGIPGAEWYLCEVQEWEYAQVKVGRPNKTKTEWTGM